MKKRYHSSSREGFEMLKERPVHSESMDRQLHREMESKEYYAGVNDRRRQEKEDADMIYEDQSAMANLPQNVVMRPYPPTGPLLPERLDDTIRGVDYQMDVDDSQRARHMKPRKA